jgi:hypothetical protein
MLNNFCKILCLGVLLASCQKKPDILPSTSTVDMSGEWYTQYYYDGDAITDFHKIITFNTSDPNSNQVWVDDLGTWPFKSKLNINYASKAFIATNAAANAEITGETVTVLEGKVIAKGGHSKTGVIVDSIYLKLQFSDDPGETYEIKGHQRTGFQEDEY